MPIADLTPQSTFTGFQKCLHREWMILQRVLPKIQDKFEEVENHIVNLLQSIFRSEISPTIRTWESVPMKEGGMAIPKPKEVSTINYMASTCQCAHLIQALLSKTDLDLIYHRQKILTVRAENQEHKATTTSQMLHKI